MPAKKTTAEAKTAKKTAVKEEKPVKAAAKTTAKAVKEAPAKAVKEEKKTVKAAAKKPAAAKKAPAKKAEPKPEVVKQTVQKYKDVINWKKWEAHHMNWLYIEVNAGDLMTEIEAGVDNLNTCCAAILDCMLEGDGFIVEPKEADKVSSSLTVRYYCDNLSEDRRRYSEVNH